MGFLPRQPGGADAAGDRFLSSVRRLREQESQGRGAGGAHEGHPEGLGRPQRFLDVAWLEVWQGREDLAGDPALARNEGRVRRVEEIDGAIHTGAVEACRKAARVVLTDAALYKHGLDYTNQFTNVYAGAPAFLRIYPDAELDRLLRESMREHMISDVPLGAFLSGGIDSPVAGHLLQKRGCVVRAVYFHSPPYTGARTRAKVEELAARLLSEGVSFSEVGGKRGVNSTELAAKLITQGAQAQAQRRLEERGQVAEIRRVGAQACAVYLSQ